MLKGISLYIQHSKVEIYTFGAQRENFLCLVVKGKNLDI
jgi:hypothetical protein